MKYKILSLTLLLFISLLGIQSCVKEYDLASTEVISPASKELINTHVYGRVMDENDQPISNAEVKLASFEGEKVLYTDEKGYFEFYNLRTLGNSAFVKIKKDGKFDAFRRWSAIKNKWNYTEVKMLDKEIVGTIDAGTGGEVETQEGAKLKLPAASVVKKSGSPYNGIINVAMKWIDPTADDLHQRIVGDLSGIDIEGNEVALATYGMMVVELLDNAGNELQIAEGKKAELTYPVPDDIHGTPPQTVPMWSYDEVLGTWIEETVASFKDNSYIAEVSHFSAWNVDWKGDRIELSGTVTVDGQTGSILTSYQIFVNSPVLGKRGGYLTPDGDFLFYNFPANEEFTLTILNICGQVVHQQSYGPYAQNTDLGTIDVGQGNQTTLTISGTALDCNNDPLPGAMVQIEYDSFTFYTAETDMAGFFEFQAPYCGSPISASLSILDIENQKTSQPQVFTIDGNDVALGNIPVCDEPEEFVSITVADTIDVFFVGPQHYIGIRHDVTSRIEAEGDGYFTIKTTEKITSAGSYESDEYSLYSRGNSNLNYWKTDPPDMTVEVTEFSNIPGELIRGTFTGSVLDSLQTTIPISGNFKIEVE